MSALLGYARVSTLEQKPELQLDALREVGCERVWTDYVSGTRKDRPELAALLGYAREGDTLVVWRLDRLGRSVAHLIELGDSLANRKIGLRSLHEKLDTTSADGRFVFNMFCALAEFERDLLRERTKAGLDAARARGRTGGRRRALDTEQLGVAQMMYDSHAYTVQTIADHLNVSRSTVYRGLRVIPRESPPGS